MSNAELQVRENQILSVFWYLFDQIHLLKLTFFSHFSLTSLVPHGGRVVECKSTEWVNEWMNEVLLVGGLPVYFRSAEMNEWFERFTSSAPRSQRLLIWLPDGFPPCLEEGDELLLLLLEKKMEKMEFLFIMYSPWLWWDGQKYVFNWRTWNWSWSRCFINNIYSNSI